MAGAWGGPATTVIAASAFRAETVLDGDERGLGAAGETQLGEDVGDVGASRTLGDPELGGDGAVRETARNAGEDLALAHGQRRERVVGRPARHGGGRTGP